MRRLLVTHHTPAEAFGPSWEQTLDEVALNDAQQAQVYWQLIDWAGSQELFTEPNGAFMTRSRQICTAI